VTTRPVIIADSGPLITLAIIGQLDLLRHMRQSLIDAVLRDVGEIGDQPPARCC